MVSLGTIIYLIARAAPRVTETESRPPRENYFDKLIKKLPLEKADAFVSAYFEWFLRKLKIVILRLDNLVSRHLHKLKPSKGAADTLGKPSIFDEKKSDDSGGVENKDNLSDINK